MLTLGLNYALNHLDETVINIGECNEIIKTVIDKPLYILDHNAYKKNK